MSETPKRNEIHAPVLNLADVAFMEHEHGESYGAHYGRVAAPLGATKLGATLFEVSPGKAAWPSHAHRVNEEMIVVLHGEGTLHLGDESHHLKVGDVSVFPPGGEEVAHKIVNTGDEVLRYLCVSTMDDPDIVEYPDSGKFGVMFGAPPGGDPEKRSLSFFGRREQALDYWDGEKS